MSFFGFLSKKKKSSAFSQSIYQLLGILPVDESLYKQALIHRSVNRNKKNAPNNERLEFLGDSVIDLVVAQWLMETFRNEQEGTLTQIRAKIVNRKNLNLCASKVGLEELIMADEKILLTNTSIPGNCLEAIVGAVYLDQGINQASKIVHDFILENANKNDLIANTNNFKSRILEWSQAEKNELEFIVTEHFNDNGKDFQAEILVDGKSIARAKGKNKKEASQNASKLALQVLNVS